MLATSALAALLLGGSVLATVPRHEQAQADPGDPSAQINPAPRAQDPDAAVTKLMRAVADGDTEAQATLGAFLLDSAEDAAQRNAALALLHSAADRGNALALLQLGMLAGDAGEHASALDYFRRAAGTGDASLQFNLGLILRDGELGPPALNEAMDWFRAAATQGHAGAQAALGAMYTRFMSHGEVAYFWLLLAAGADPAAIPLRDQLAAHLDEDRREIVQASARDWRPGEPGLPHASGRLWYVQLGFDPQDPDQVSAREQQWTIIDALARPLASAQDGDPAGIELLLSPVWIDRAKLADASTAGMGLAAHLGLAIRLDTSRRAVSGLLHDETGYAEYEFDDGFNDFVVRDGWLLGTLRIEQSSVIGGRPGILIDVQVSAPLLDH